MKQIANHKKVIEDRYQKVISKIFQRKQVCITKPSSAIISYDSIARSIFLIKFMNKI